MDTNQSSRSKVSIPKYDDESEAAGPLQVHFTVEDPQGRKSKGLMESCINMLVSVVRFIAGLRVAMIRRWQSFKKKSKPVRGIILWLLCNLLFDIPYCLFVYSVLIKGHIQVNKTNFDAVTANLLVSIFSQMSATFIDAMLREYLSVVRFKLAARDRGTRAATFLGIGPASQWTSTARLVFACRAVNVLMGLRLALPGLAIAIGAVLKINANFETHFVFSGAELPVYAGLIPMDDRLVQGINVTDLCQYVGSWTANLQGSSRYAVRTSLEGCNNGCRALLWPGGMETARQARSSANYSAFHGGHFDNASAVQIENAPGFITAYSLLPLGFMFEEADCVYGGLLSNDSLKMCARQMDQGVAAGWMACPQHLKDTNRCDTEPAWKQAPMASIIKIDAYRQYTSTIYDRSNLSIIDSRPNGKPQQLTLHATQYTDIFRKIMVPTANATSMDNATLATLAFNLAWMHRTFTEVFPDNTGTINTSLENVLTVPLQWSITAYQYVNYTLEAQSPLLDTFPIPDYMRTVARGGSSVQRLAIQPWTGWLFIAAHIAILLFVLANIIWIMSKPLFCDDVVNLPELDTLARAPAITCYELRTRRPLWPSRRAASGQAYERSLHLDGLALDVQDTSSWKSTKNLRDWQVKVAEAST